MNKIILLALGVSLCLSAYVPSGYTSIPLTTGNANATIQTALNFGESAIVTALAKGNYISNTNFNVSQVVSYAQQVQGTATNFAFSAVFSNYNDTTISSNYTVSRSKTGTLTLLSYSVTISKTTPVASDFVDVSPSEVASSQLIQALLKAGFNLVVAQVQQSNSYITGPFTVNVTNSVQRQALSNGTILYKFNVQGYNNNSVEIAAAYALSYTASTGKTILLASTYVIVDGDTVDDLGELESGSGYTQISQATVNSSALIQKIRDFGIKTIVADGVQKGKIPNNTYVVSATNGVYMDQLSSTVTDYKFNLVLTDNKGTTITAIYIVSYDSQTQDEEMVGFVYTSQRSG